MKSIKDIIKEELTDAANCYNTENKMRYINFEPGVTYFKPRGIPLFQLDEVELNIDEMEAIRLCDLEDLEQIKCAKKMKISQSTFQRILASAHQKIAQALIGGRAIKIIERSSR